MKKTKLILLAAILVLLVIALPGCRRDHSGVPTLIWWTIGSNSPNLPMYSRILSEYTEAKIGVRIDMRQAGWATAGQRFNAMINTGERFDILFTDANTYTTFSRLGAFADISSLVREVTPALFYSMPEELWRGVTLDGRIFGVPTYKDSSQTQFAFWDAALVERYDLDLEWSWENLDRNFRRMKEGGGPRFFPHVMSRSCVDAIHLWHEAVIPLLEIVAVRYDDSSRRVVLTLEEPEILEAYRFKHRWFNDGITNPDANIIDTVPQYRPYLIVQAWPSVAASMAFSAGIESYIPVPFFGPFYSNHSIQGSINAISVNSRHKREALKLLELVNTDPVFRDMLTYGIEGNHFEYVIMPEDGRRAVRRLNTGWPLVNFQLGNFFILTPEETVPAGFWDEVRYQNENAFPSYLLGFTMNITPVENEVINSRNTWARYSTDLRTGARDPDVLIPHVIARLRRNGIDRIIAEAQRQIDEFFGAN